MGLGKFVVTFDGVWDLWLLILYGLILEHRLGRGLLIDAVENTGRGFV